MAAPYSTLEEFQNSYDEAKGNAFRAQDSLDDAHDWLHDLAPPPDPAASLVSVVEDYEARGARAVRKLAAYLYRTGGFVKSQNVSAEGAGKSGSYGDASGVLEVVSRIMGLYYAGEKDAPGSNVARVGWF